MILEKVTIENFKGIKNPVTINLKTITLLFGQNSSGKSSIIQALNYAYQILVFNELETDISKSPNRDGIDLGGFKHMVHRQNLEHPIIFDFQLSFKDGNFFTDFLSDMIDVSAGHSGCPIRLDRLDDRENGAIFPDDTIIKKPRYIDPSEEHLMKKLRELTKNYTNPEPQMIEIGKKIQKINVKLIIRWNDEMNKPYIELYQVKANNNLFFQVFRSKCIEKTTLFSFYENKILPDYINDQISNIVYMSKVDEEHKEEERAQGELYHMDDIFEYNKNNYEDGKLNISPEKWYRYTQRVESRQKIVQELDDLMTDGMKYVDDNLLFHEYLIQNTILPKTDELINVTNISCAFFGDFEFFGGLYKDGFVKNDKLFLKQLLSMFVTTPLRALKTLFQESYCHIGPLRELPQRNHLPLNPRIFSRWISGIAAYDALLDNNTSQEVIDETNTWLSSEDRFNTGYQIDIKRYKALDKDNPLFTMFNADVQTDPQKTIREIEKTIHHLPEKTTFQIKDVSQNIPLSMQDVGTGISQILPIIVGVHYLNSSLVCIEQPELHIHPALQAEMGDLFLNQIPKTGSRKPFSFVVETHSEHLMLRILRRIRETKDNEKNTEHPVFPDDIAVHYVVKDDNVTDVIHIPITEEGEFLIPWPHGFFPERARELFS
jgi:energy-coupling factor transporter ATP-binding protein EcfA2